MTRGPSLLRALLDAALAALTQGQRSGRKGPAQRAPERTQGAARATWRKAPTSGAHESVANPTDHDVSPGQSGSGATRDLTAGELRAMQPSYAPSLDGEPDPGEVIWTWVPYVENDGRGKDRPVLIIARLDSESWAACYLSTKQHRDFVSVGTGSWDSQGRESYLSPERVLRVTESGMRRESTGIDRADYDQAVRAIMAWHGLT